MCCFLQTLGRKIQDFPSGCHCTCGYLLLRQLVVTTFTFTITPNIIGFIVVTQRKAKSCVYLRLDILPSSKTENKKAFLSSNLARLCAVNKVSVFSPSPPCRMSSVGVLRERSISTWLSLIHWARKNCLAN